MSNRPNSIPCVEINLPELFEREDFRAYLNDPKNTIATWHRSGEAPDECSDVFVTYDNGDGSNSDMPGWGIVCDMMRENGHTAALVRLTNMED